MNRNSNASSSPASSQETTKVVGSQSTAKRIGNWATNLLVSGVILIVGISFGREVMRWWRNNPLPAAASSSAATQVEDSLARFGDMPIGLRSTELVGELEDVLSELRQAARQALQETQITDHDPGPAERQMLAGTKKLTPVEELPNEWAIYQLEAPLPMVVGIRFVDGQVAARERRVVSWGMAMPGEPEGEGTRLAWKLVTTAIGTSVESTAAEFALPTPPQGHRTLSLQTAEGLVLAGFQGHGDAHDWMKFYDSQLAEIGFEPAGDWVVEPSASRRRFSQPMRTVDVAIHAGPDASLQTILVMTPRSNSE
jgi:hypothetical protein